MEMRLLKQHIWYVRKATRKTKSATVRSLVGSTAYCSQHLLPEPPNSVFRRLTHSYLLPTFKGPSHCHRINQYKTEATTQSQINISEIVPQIGTSRSSCEPVAVHVLTKDLSELATGLNVRVIPVSLHSPHSHKQLI